MRFDDVRIGYVRFLFLALCFVMCIEFDVSAQRAKPGEYEVKAAFLINFIKFIEWPEDRTSSGPTCSVCILGDNPFGAALKTIQDKTVGGKRVTTKQCKDAEDIKGCQILFISASEKSRLGNILAEVGNSGILTVGDMKGFAQAGGVIQFVIEEDKIHFIINADAADRSKLRISSKLLRLAHTYRE
jgi:hypothetical protein